MNITPETTQQQIFDHVWDHFIVKGNPRSVDEEDSQSCMYRGPNGRRCAAGLFIPDDKYDEDFEGRAISDVEGELDLGWSQSQLRALTELQAAHDNPACADRTFFADLLRYRGRYLDLEVPA